MNCLVFDIETIPDLEAGRKIYNLTHDDDNAAAAALQLIRREETGGSDFLRLPLQRIVAISVVLHNHEQCKVWSLGDVDSSERDILERFFAGLERYRPTLVSWNGSGFDLPVIHYRALRHQISAPSYWDTGNHDQSFRWNNYLNRYHERHLDLMDVLSGYQARATAPLDQVATLLGFPGKLGMDGSQVWRAYQAGDITGIRNYCETDVLNTYLVYLRFELMRGHLTESRYQGACNQLRAYLAEQQQAHFDGFLAAWPQADVC